MNPRGAAARHPAVRRIGEACAVALFVMLPALVVGAQLDAPVTAGELHRLGIALQAGAGELPHTSHSVVADRFHVLTLGDAAVGLPATAAEQAALVGRARLAQVAFVFAISGLVYVTMVIAGRRLAGLAACLLLAALPAVLHEGHVLRPETPATALGLLAIVLLQCMARLPRLRRGGARTSVRLQVAGLLACACTALGLSLAALPSRSMLLIVPGCVLSLAVLRHVGDAFAIVRRRGLFRLPLHAFNARLLPWTAASLLGPLTVALVVHLSVTGSTRELLPSVGNHGLWPDSSLLRWPCLGIAAIGAAAFVVRSGARLGRQGRIGPDLVLLVYCAVQLASQTVAPTPQDGLRATPAAAMLFGNGVVALAALAFGLLRRGASVTGRRDR